MVTFEIGLPEIFGLVAGGLVAYAWFRAKLKKIRVFFDTVDDALFDDKVSDAEFNAIFKALKALLIPK